MSLGLALVVAEIALRLVRPQFTLIGASFYAEDPDPRLGFRLRPGHDGTLEGVGEFHTRVRVDGRGLRGGTTPAAEAPAAPLPGAALERTAPAVLGVGDSFAFGWGVEAEETYLALASRRVGAEPLNAGVPNYSTCQSAALAERLLPALRPRVVAITTFAGNDELDELVPVASYRVEGGRLRARGEAPKTGWRRALRAVTDRSHLLRAARSSALGGGIARLVGAPPPARERLLRDALRAYEEPPPEAIAQADARITACLARLRAQAAAAGAEVLALVLPADLGVVPGALDAIAAELGEADRALRAGAPGERLAAAAARAGVTVVDLHAPLAAAAAAGAPVYYPQDRHLTPAGHRVVADALAPRLAAAVAPPSQRP